MNVSEPLLECAEILQRRGLVSMAIFLLESSKPCFGLFREGLNALLPMLNLFLKDARIIDALRDLQTADDIERFIRVLEKSGARAN
jgi:hypothetical protein